MIVIFSYDRKQALKDLIDSLEGERIIVVDDGSDYNYTDLNCEYYRYDHQGRQGFWTLWGEALKLCDDEWVLFLQDDVTNVNLKEIKRLTEGLDLYAFNIMHRGTHRGWTNIKHEPTTIKGIDCHIVSYVDCIFATNKKTLDKLGRHMNPVSPFRFENPYISSGVGQQLSQRFKKLGIPMYMPDKSLAYHGDHESKMHPQERKYNPLCSII